jgi:hypothetical protein
MRFRKSNNRSDGGRARDGSAAVINNHHVDESPR